MEALCGCHCRLMSKYVGAERLTSEDSCLGWAHWRNPMIVDLQKVKRVVGSWMSKLLHGHLWVQENESLRYANSLL